MFVWVCIFVCASVGRFVTAQGPMSGQLQEAPVNSTGVWTAALFAVAEFNRNNTEDLFAYKILNITSAETQVVSGIKYFLDVLLGRTVCKTNDTTDSQPCAYSFNPKELQCDFVIWDVPWEHSLELTQNKCHLHNN